MPAPEQLTRYLDLLRAVLNLARADAFASREPLQLALWLIYRILDLDYRCLEAYLFLAYLFCLTQDWTRACQVLLHADRLKPGDPDLQTMLTQIRFTLQHPLPLEAKAIRAMPPSDQAKEPTQSTRLPRLDVLREQFTRDFPDSQELAGRFAQLQPVLQNLMRRGQSLS